ncbi:MAG: Uma2 family endonuclease [Proteobacteria bacterium]|nr:Uma2 family endonuclease [Pseudomonadota bacterium]
MEAISPQLDYEGRELPERHEIVDGVLVKKASPSGRHSGLQWALVEALAPFRGPPGRSRPGGWWFGTEIDVQLASGQRYVPDLAGWRLESFEASDLQVFSGIPCHQRPDWVCEVLSPSTASRDLGTKKRNYHLAGVGHYWVLHPEKRALTVLRRIDDGYQVILQAKADDAIHAEPFGGVELDMREFFALLP